MKVSTGIVSFPLSGCTWASTLNEIIDTRKKGIGNAPRDAR